jgi:hypothetical protein
MIEQLEKLGLNNFIVLAISEGYNEPENYVWESMTNEYPDKDYLRSESLVVKGIIKKEIQIKKMLPFLMSDASSMKSESDIANYLHNAFEIDWDWAIKISRHWFEFYGEGVASDMECSEFLRTLN